MADQLRVKLRPELLRVAFSRLFVAERKMGSIFWVIVIIFKTLHRFSEKHALLTSLNLTYEHLEDTGDE